MKTFPSPLLRFAHIVCACLWLTALQPAAGQTNFTLLKSFNGGAAFLAQGANPMAGVIQANDGWLYGTTPVGGTNGVTGGTVFKLRTNGADFVVLKSFSGADGLTPAAPVLEAGDGMLYGTTLAGGISNFGTVFKMSRDGSSFAVLHHFSGDSDGATLYGSLIEGSDGYLYGTTYIANGTTRGTIFKLDKNGGHYAIIHTFTGIPDGQQPECRLLKGSDGALYGGTPFGGATGLGTVFKVNEDGSGYTIIRNFTGGSNGPGPNSGLIEGSDGMLYGSAELGGSGGGGTIFKLDRNGGGFAVIHSFTNSGTGLRTPAGELVEAGGLLYGATSAGGVVGKGGIFKLSKDGSSYTVLRDFVGRTGGGDGDSPHMALFRSSDELFYGTTQFGGPTGTGGAGCVFVLSSVALPPRALTLSMSGGSSVIQFAGTAVAPYVIERSTNLNTWSDVFTVTSPIYGATSFTNDSPPQPAAFYRVRLQ